MLHTERVWLCFLVVMMAEPILSAEALDYYYDKADEFIDDNFIAPARKTMPGLSQTWQQRDLAKAVSKDNRISIESGHGSGKSTMLSWLSAWFLLTRHNTLGYQVKIPCIAPTFHQLWDIFAAELWKWIPLSRVAPLIDLHRDEYYIKGHQATSYIRLRSPKTPNHVQGFHAPHLLWLCDEAFGITSDAVWETIEGSLTEPDNKIIVAGQHTLITGYVHDTFGKDKDFWHNLRFDSEESPIAKPEFAARIARKYGRDSDVFRVRVKGMAPAGNPSAFIQLVDVDAARVREVDFTGKLSMGLDCARFGDDVTCAILQKGNRQYSPVVHPYSNTDAIVDLALQELRRHRKDTKDAGVCTINIDVSGGYGAGAYDELSKNTTDNIRVVGINFGGGGDERYADNATIMWAELRDQLPHMQLPDDDFLIEELATRRKGKFDSKNRERVEPKADFKKEYGASPDRADASVLANTKASAPNLVFGAYFGTNPDFRKNFEIDFEHTKPADAQVYGVLIRDKDAGIYGNWFFWGRKSKILWVYSEMIHTSPVVDRIASDMAASAHCPLTDVPNYLNVSRVVANQDVFDSGVNVKKVFRQVGINLKSNPRYEESGAILLINRMFALRQIVVHYDACPETDRQYSKWRIENGRPVGGYPMCQALMVLVSMLKEDGELTRRSDDKPYSKKKQIIRKNLQEGKIVGMGYGKKPKTEWDNFV